MENREPYKLPSFKQIIKDTEKQLEGYDNTDEQRCPRCGGSGILADPNRFGEPDQNTIRQCDACKSVETDEQRCPHCGWWSEKGEWVERESLHKLLGKLGSGLDRIEEKLDNFVIGGWK